MRKILAATALSLLALAPASSVWAASGGPTPKDGSPVDVGTTEVGAKKLFAYGCEGGVAFALWTTPRGMIRGTDIPMITCVGRDWIVLAE